MVDVGGLLGQQRGRMEGRADGDHQFEPLRDGREGRRRAPGVECGRVGALDVVEVQFGDEGQIVADLLAAAGEPAHVIPRGRHAFVFDVAEPTAENGEPIAVAHLMQKSGNPGDLGFEEIDQPGMRIETDDTRRVRDEVGKGVHVVIDALAVAVVDHGLDAAHVDAGTLRNRARTRR